MSSQQDNQEDFRKALDNAIKAQGLVPPNKRIDRLKSDFDEHIYVIGQLSWKLKALGVSDALLSKLLNARFDTIAMDGTLTKKEKRILEMREVDETICRIQEAIATVEALAPSGPIKESRLATDKGRFEQRFLEDDERKEFVREGEAVARSPAYFLTRRESIR